MYAAIRQGKASNAANSAMANFAMRFERRPRGSKHLHAAGQIARDDKVRS